MQLKYGLNVTNPSHSSCLFVCKIFQRGARREASGGWGRKASSWRYWHFEQHSFTSMKVKNRPLSQRLLYLSALSPVHGISTVGGKRGWIASWPPALLGLMSVMDMCHLSGISGAFEVIALEIIMLGHGALQFSRHFHIHYLSPRR